jgi:hypothetical protein
MNGQASKTHIANASSMGLVFVSRFSVISHGMRPGNAVFSSSSGQIPYNAGLFLSESGCPGRRTGIF